MAVESVRDFHTAATLPPIPGLRFRHISAPADYPRMNDAANEAREASGVHFITPLEGFVSFYEGFDPVHCDRDRDVVIADVGGEIAGYGRTEWYDEPDGTRFHEVFGFVRPAWRRRGIGTSMLATLEERAAAVAAQRPPSGPSFYQGLGNGAPGEDLLFEQAGFEPVRYGYTMVRPNLDPVPNAEMPEGLEIRPVKKDHLRAIFEAADEAFRDAWGYSAATERDWELFLTDPLNQDHELWRIAWDGDQIAGQVRGYINIDENDRFGLKRGWVENISVRQPWRRRGLARALINATIEGLRGRGMTEGALGVDTQNVTGALQLYESVGFRPVSRSTTYRKPMPAR
jgi:mycothiol synthase